MADRRRNNPPTGAETYAPLVITTLKKGNTASPRPRRSRGPNELRNIFLKTGITPTASGSAYLEIQPTPIPKQSPVSRTARNPATLKITCAIHGPKPLPRSAPFSPNLVLTTSIKYAPFATRERKGYQRDSQERDLAAHLDTALRGVVIGDRWPKCGADVVITVLEAEEDEWVGGHLKIDDQATGKEDAQREVSESPKNSISRKSAASGSWGAMNALAGCITVASAALVDAGIDCVDLIAGGVSASLATITTTKNIEGDDSTPPIILDPSPMEHDDITSVCVVGYLPNRDEITELWCIGETESSITAEKLVDGAVAASNATAGLLADALLEAAREKIKAGEEEVVAKEGVDVDMGG